MGDKCIIGFSAANQQRRVSQRGTRKTKKNTPKGSFVCFARQKELGPGWHNTAIILRNLRTRTYQMQNRDGSPAKVFFVQQEPGMEIEMTLENVDLRFI